MPLAWAHAEFIKLAHSWAIKRPFDRPSPVWERYHGRRSITEFAVWSVNAQLATLPAGLKLRLYLPRPAALRWRTLDIANFRQATTSAAGLGFHMIELDTRHLRPNQCLNFIVQYEQEPQIQLECTIKIVAAGGK
jgi:glucoamylase